VSAHRRPTAAGVRSARIRAWLSNLIHDFIADDREPEATPVEWDKPVPVHTISPDGEPIWNGGQW
jgi:hypothetical protein